MSKFEKDDIIIMVESQFNNGTFDDVENQYLVGHTYIKDEKTMILIKNLDTHQYRLEDIDQLEFEQHLKPVR